MADPDNSHRLVPTIDAGPAHFRPSVTPKIGGSPVGPIQADGVGTANLTPHYWLVTVNPGDDVTAATRLKAGYPDCFLVAPGMEFPPILSDVAITDVYMIAVDALAATPANYTGNLYIVAKGDTSLANWLANMCHMTFDLAQAVKEVNAAVTAAYGSYYATAQIGGVSHA